ELKPDFSHGVGGATINAVHVSPIRQSRRICKPPHSELRPERLPRPLTPSMSPTREKLAQFAVDVILDRRQGLRASMLRALLSALSRIYEFAVSSRLGLYRHRILRERSLGCLVVSIGNLTVGGTGKTPVLEEFARPLQDGGRRVAILRRGYQSGKQPLLKRLLVQLQRTHAIAPTR